MKAIYISVVDEAVDILKICALQIIALSVCMEAPRAVEMSSDVGERSVKEKISVQMSVVE